METLDPCNRPLESERTEQALRKSEALFRALFQNSHDSIVIRKVLPDGSLGPIVDANDVACRRLGYTRDELVGMPPGAYVATDQQAEQAISREQLKAMGELTHRTVHVTKDGRRIPVEVVSRLLEVGGERLVIRVHRDITEQELAQESLRRGEERYRSILQTAMDGFWLVDKDSSILDVNEAYCRMSGYSRDELLAMSIADLEALKSPDEVAVHCEQLERDGQGRFESQHRHKDGRLFDVEVSVVYLPSGRGGFVAFIHDITERKLAEAALAQSEARYRSYIEHSPIGVYVADEAGHYRDVNRAACEQVGYTREELVQMGVFQMVPPEDVEDTRDNLAKLRSTGAISQELRLQRKDGSALLIILNAVRLPEGGFMAFCTDITKRKRAEEALRQSETRFRALVEGAPDAVFVQTGRRIRYVNRAGCQLFGAERPEQLLGKSVLEVLHPSFVPIVRQRLHGLYVEKQRQPVIEQLYLRLDGSTVPVEVSSVPISYDGDDGALVFVRDITERKRAEEALRESEARYRALFDNISCGVAIYDAVDNGEDFVFKDLNKAGERMDGDRREDIIGKSVLEVHPGVREFGLFDVFKRVWQTGRPEHLPVSLYKDDRLSSYFENYVYKLPSGEIVAVHDDITLRKRAEEQQQRLQSQLAQAQKMESVGRLAGGVAHDFNNMLGVILGHAEMAMAELDPAQPLFADLQEIRKAAERSAALTNQLLAFARKQTIAPRVLDLNQTVEGTLKMLRRLIGEDIDLAWLPAGDLWPVKLDPAQIDQILANLCVNARDAIAGVGKVTIETANAVFDEAYCTERAGYVPGEYTLLAVSDNGCGMDRETQARLFEPFFTTKGPGKGTGLGLATVYGIVKQNNGFINVYSETGVGSTFRIYLPRHAVMAAHSQQMAQSQPAQRGRETILLVEDEPAILKMAGIMLERLGYTVLSASTPGEAIRIAEEHESHIDLLMTDVVMPEMNGRDLARRLLSIHPNLKRLFTSGYTANVIAHHGVLEEGIDFIQKPFSMRDLGGRVREALDRE